MTDALPARTAECVRPAVLPGWRVAARGSACATPRA